jgi:hypothetical protein
VFVVTVRQLVVVALVVVLAVVKTLLHPQLPQALLNLSEFEETIVVLQ